MFHPSCIFSTLAQAAIHLATMAVGVNYGRQLEGTDNLKRSSRISFSEGSRPKKVSKLLGALADREFEGHDEETTSLFRRPPFRANYETNIVFIFSILQSAVSSLTNHRGEPFYRSILESRELCFASAFTTLFSVVCIAETFPFINTLLELRPLPSRKSKFCILGIATFNILACVFCRILSEIPFKNQAMGPKVNKEGNNAADLEETLLEEESKQNLRGIFLVFGLMTYLVLDIFSKP
jgi:magnesium-transporting ATPase (P-type)